MSWTRYSDVGDVIELGAVFDDALKKDDVFCKYAVLTANRILEDLEIKAIASWGKWGARLEPEINPHMTRQQLENIATLISNHPAWNALKESTRIFTYGNQNEDVTQFQAKCEKCGKYGHFTFQHDRFNEE